MPEPDVDAPPVAGRFADLRSFGAFLRSQREQRGVTLARIAERTKLIVSRFESLERGDVHQLPEGIYRRAIVRAYASAIGLDPEEIVGELFKLVAAQETPVPALTEAPPERGAVRVRLPRSIALIAVGVVLGASATAMVLWPAAPVLRDPAVETQPAPVQPPVAASDTPVATIGHTVGQDTARTADVHLASNDLAAPPPADRQVDNALRVTSNPSGARVTVNGIGWGFTPLTIRHLPPGTKRVRLSKDGFRSTETTVTLAGDGPASVRLSLQRFDAR